MEPLVEAPAPPADVDEAQRAPTPAAALDLLGAAYREDTPQTAALEAALRRQDTMAESLVAMERAARPAHFFRAGDAPLWGGTFGRQAHAFTHAWNNITAAGFLTFCSMSCAFVRADARSFSPLESGSLVHYILEHVMRRADAEFPVLRRRSWPGWPARWPTNTWPKTCPPQGGALPTWWKRLKRGVTRLLAYLQAEQAQSLFHPAAFEQEIGTGEGAVPR